MTLGIAVLDLLSLAASQQPLLLVLDDGQWLDAASIEVCGFVGRRLTGSSVKLVVGLRSGVPSGFDTAALPELPVTTLSEKTAEQLLDLRHPGLDPRIRRLVLDEAQGNPLALLELPPHVRGGRAGRNAEELFGYTGVPCRCGCSRCTARVSSLSASRCVPSCCAVPWTGSDRARRPITPGAPATVCATPTRPWPAGCWTSTRSAATSSSGTPWCARRSSRPPHPTSAARHTRPSPICTGTTSNVGPHTWPPRPSTRTNRWRRHWRPPRTPRPGGAAR